jgi:hypothetical protein
VERAGSSGRTDTHRERSLRGPTGRHDARRLVHAPACMSGVSPVDELRIDTTVVGDSAHILIPINDVSLLELQRPDHRPDGSPYPSGPRRSYRPTRLMFVRPTPVSCCRFTCPTKRWSVAAAAGNPGCGSLWLLVGRDGQTVLWEADRLTVRLSIDATYGFEMTG